MKPIVLLFITLLAVGAHSAEPLVTYQRDKIIVQPPKGIRLLGQNTEILSTVDCPGNRSSAVSISIPERCGYLHGLYRVIFQIGNSKMKRQLFTDFSITKNSNGTHTFLLGESIEIDEGHFPQNPLY